MAQAVACGRISALKLEAGVSRVADAGKLNGSTSSSVVGRRRTNFVVASVSREVTETCSSSRRSMMSLLAATVVAAGAAFSSPAGAVVDIKLEGAPPPSGGLPGTENADQARDTDLDLNKRFFLQALPPSEAVGRVKQAADQIISVKSLIDKKAWPYVQNDLRSKAQYLGFDLKSIIDSKDKLEKKELSALKDKLFQTINDLDYAAREKSTPKAEKYYAEAVSLLNTLVSKIA